MEALSDNVPGETNEAAEIIVASCVIETAVAGTGLPFTYTVAALENGPSVRVTVVVPEPCMIVAGATDVTALCGYSSATVAELELELVFAILAVTLMLPAGTSFGAV